MDDNKLIKLKEIGYTINKCCYLCQYSKFIGEWGTCFLHTYKHLKHTNSERNLSIHQAGGCKDFKLSKFKNIHGFKDLM